MSSKIQIISRSIRPADIKNGLEKFERWESRDIQFELQSPSTQLRTGLDPTVLVAIVGAAGTGMGALITGLMQFLNQNAQKKIVLQTKDGTRLEVPANTPVEKIDLLLKKLQPSPVEKIIIP